MAYPAVSDGLVQIRARIMHAVSRYFKAICVRKYFRHMNRRLSAMAGRHTCWGNTPEPFRSCWQPGASGAESSAGVIWILKNLQSENVSLLRRLLAVPDLMHSGIPAAA